MKSSTGIETKKIMLRNDNDDKRRLFESCQIKGTRVVNPIVDWSSKDVWGFIQDAKVPMNPLYEEGKCRVGCIGCPLATRKSREADFRRFPTYKQAYIRAFDKMLEVRRAEGKIDAEWRMGNTGQDVFNWWMEYDVLPGQMEFTDEDLEV